MNASSKITFSTEEQLLVHNTNFILTKLKIIDKINHLFGKMATEMAEKIVSNSNVPAAVKIIAPKIAKGENYLQLPYLILDYPRCFNKENNFAIRTMFWWGNFFSCTLHLSGNYKKIFLSALLKNIEMMQQKNLFICINTNEWEHHFEPDNYIPVKNLSVNEIKDILHQQHFIKVAAKFSLQHINHIDALLQNCFDDFLRLLKN